LFRADRAVRKIGAVLALVGLAASLAAAPRAIASEPYIEGIDVSRWQGEPSWSKVKAAGVRFVIAKATQGDALVDPQYARNRARLRAVGIPFTAYHYAGPEASAADAIAEADQFLNTAGLNGRNLLPVLDLELHNDLTPDELADWARAWLMRVEERLGVKAIIYTKSAFWTERMGDTTWFADNGYRLWIAHWNVESPTLPAVNWGGRGWTLWQHAVRAGLDGISGKVDRNRYNGTSLAPLRIKNNR
jgi:lysozyme